MPHTRFWHRRARLVIAYGVMALFSASLAVTAGYVGMAVLAHMAWR